MLMEGNVHGLQQRPVGGGREYRRKRKSAAECADPSRPDDLQVSLLGRPVEHRHKNLATAPKTKPFTDAESSMIPRRTTSRPLGNDKSADDDNAADDDNDVCLRGNYNTADEDSDVFSVDEEEDNVDVYF